MRVGPGAAGRTSLQAAGVAAWRHAAGNVSADVSGALTYVSGAKKKAWSQAET